MSQENQSYLRFSLEESLWFRKGQEVEELISISLDPDITIQENDQYVTIRGSLELSGEYKSFKDENESAEDNVASQKFVERVDEREEEGVCEFSHCFPVDITIPNNRIQSIYDIDVLVDSFDYSLPERSCLKLSAELMISGLYGTEQEEEAEPELEVLHRFPETDVEEAGIEPAVIQSTFDNDFLFETEARKQQEEESAAEMPKFPNFNYQPEEQETANRYQPPWKFEEYNNEYQAPWQTQDPRAEEKKVVEVEVEEEIVVEQEMHAEESSSSPEEAPIVKKKKAGKKKTMTLTEFFARKDENTAHAKLKVCIVQKGDTVESLADRYDISVQSLLRVNRLDTNQDVYEGQVLYVPATVGKK